MRENEKGFGIIEIILIIAVIGLLCVVGWIFFDKQKDTKNNENTITKSEQTKTNNIQESNSTVEPTKEVVKTSIYPNDSNGNTSKDFYTTILPSGWSVEKVYEPYNIVKTIGNEKYLISSFIEDNSDKDIMKQRIAEGIETITSVKTSSGTSVSVLKTSTVLFLASCKPTGENCYLQLNSKKLYIHLYKVIPGAQSARATDFPEDIINDFESIAKSLSI